MHYSISLLLLLLPDKLHTNVYVGNKLCRGGIDIDTVQQLFMDDSLNLFTKHFLKTVPNQFLEFDLKNAQQCAEHLRYVKFLLNNLEDLNFIEHTFVSNNSIF